MLPGPLHLLPSLIFASCFTPLDKLNLCRILAEVAVRAPGNQTNAGDYLRSLSCNENLMKRVFEPIIVSALNENPDDVSAEYARMILSTALLGGKGAYRMGIADITLTELIGEAASRFLSERGCEIRLNARVGSLKIRGDRVDSLILYSGEEMRAELCVCAVPPWDLTKMGLETQAARLLSWRPIVGAHLFFEYELPDFDCTCVVDEPFQWVFNKSKDFGLPFSYIQAVASAASSIVNLRRSDLIYLALRAAAKAMPEPVALKLSKALVVRERRATFSTSVGSDAVRPGTCTHLNNLFLAGDWVSTHWPATIESAVRSGIAAAREVKKRI
jgi:zeta-carotene desaturase